MHPDLMETRMFDEVLEPLTDISSVSSRCSSPESNGFPEPLRKRPRGDGKNRRVQQHKVEGDILFPGFRVAKSFNWHLHEARKSITAFKGRPDQLCSERPNIPKGTPPKEHLNLLEKNGYSIIKVR